MFSQQISSPGVTWDVVIIGAGPAGAATAITLAKLGQSVLLVDERVAAQYKLGESLPPSSIDLVRHFLDFDGNINQSSFGLFKTSGNISLWDSEQPEQRDFFFSTTGYGLCIDRLAFDEALRTKAQAVGVTLLRGFGFRSCQQVTCADYLWELTLGSYVETQRHRARYLVDCSGRRAVVAQSLGVSIKSHDRLFAYAQWFSSNVEDEDTYTRIEAGANGWWYTNRIPANQNNKSKRLVVFHSDKDLPAAKLASHSKGFDLLLNESILLGPLLQKKGYQSEGSIRGAPANSQRLMEFCGDGWIAVGDAAQAYDPLSSQGIDKSLRTGSHAGHLIHYALSELEKNSALDKSNFYIRQYAEQQEQLWLEYLRRHNFYYTAQCRWKSQKFWSRRTL